MQKNGKSSESNKHSPNKKDGTIPDESETSCCVSENKTIATDNEAECCGGETATAVATYSTTYSTYIQPADDDNTETDSPQTRTMYEKMEENFKLRKDVEMVQKEMKLAKREKELNRRESQLKEQLLSLSRGKEGIEPTQLEVMFVFRSIF